MLDFSQTDWRLRNHEKMCHKSVFKIELLLSINKHHTVAFLSTSENPKNCTMRSLLETLKY